MSINLGSALLQARFVLGALAATALLKKEEIGKILEDPRVKKMPIDPTVRDREVTKLLNKLHKGVNSGMNTMAGGINTMAGVPQYDTVDTLLEVIGDHIYKTNPELAIKLYTNIVDAFNNKCGKIKPNHKLYNTSNRRKHREAMKRKELLKNIRQALRPIPTFVQPSSDGGGAAM
jgi:hypothetical protein